MVKNLPTDAGDKGSIPGREDPHAAEHLGLCVTTAEPGLSSPRAIHTEN